MLMCLAVGGLLKGWTAWVIARARWRVRHTASVRHWLGQMATKALALRFDPGHAGYRLRLLEE